MTDVETPQHIRPIRSVLDLLRARIDHAAFDAAVFSLESVVADLGFGDIRPLVGSIAWIDRLRTEGKRIALVFSGESAESALEIAGVRDRFDVVISGPPTAGTLRRALEALETRPDRAAAVDTSPDGIAAAREVGCLLAIAVARGPATPEQLRRGGASTVVADLMELLGPT